MIEPTRMTLYYGGQFVEEDIVVWGLGFSAVRDYLPFSKVPVAQFNDNHLVAQSGSLARFAAQAVGIYPLDPVLCARCDAVFELGQELCTINPLINCYTGQQYQQVKAWYFDRLPESLFQLENQLADGEDLFFCGSKVPTHADFNIFHMLHNVKVAEPHYDWPHPKLDKWFQLMDSLLADFTSKRPKLVGVGSDPALVDSNGTHISQRLRYNLTFLDRNGLFQSYNNHKGGREDIYEHDDPILHMLQRVSH